MASDGTRLAGLGCRSEEHTSELQSRSDLVCRLLLEKKKTRHIAACSDHFTSYLVGGAYEFRAFVRNPGYRAFPISTQAQRRTITSQLQTSSAEEVMRPDYIVSACAL